MRQRAAQVAGQWQFADRMLRQLAVIGLPELREEVGPGKQAMDDYQARWGTDHPVRLVDQNSHT